MCTENASDHTERDEGRRRFRACFPDRERVFLPVIYTAAERQALYNVDIAREATADGVFLINHGIDYQHLLRIVQKVVGLHPRFFVGVNCLDLQAQDVIRQCPPDIAGIWANDPPTSVRPAEATATVRQARDATDWDGLIFATATASYVDVPTIVGSGAGWMLDVGSYRQFRRALAGRPLGLAGRISSESVGALLAHADCIMTAACTNRDLERMNLEEARQLAARIHAFSGLNGSAQ